MLNLNEREWKAFNLIDNDMFYIDEVKTFKSTALVENDGVFDIVGATSKNNGNVGFLPKQYADYLINGNCICLIKTGQGSVGDAVYKQGAFIPSNNICVIRSSWLNRYNGMFIVAEINKQADRYSYGYIRNNSRIRKEQLMLPTTDGNTPDYAFMEQYIREREDKLKQKYIDFVNAELETPPAPLAEKEWKEFKIAALFKIVSGRDVVLDSNLGNVPYINSSGVNNGITQFVNKSKVIVKNCITIARTGTVGAAFYQKSEVAISGNIRALIPIGFMLNQEIALFLIQTIKNTTSGRFSYGKILGTDRISNLKMLLPITDDGSPDYQYMEQYIKAVMFGKYKKYLEYQKC